MKKYYILFHLVVCSIAGSAEQVRINDRLDVVLESGEIYANARVTSIDADSIVVINKDGISTVKMRHMIPDLRARFNFDQAASSASELEKESKKRQYSQDYVINQEAKEFLRGLGQASLYIKVKIVQIVDDGALVSGSMVPSPFKQTTVVEYRQKELSSAGLNGPWIVSVPVNVTVQPEYFELPLSFLNLNTSGRVDGSTWGGLVWASGVYRYQAVSGGGSTVRKYTSNIWDVIPEKYYKVISEMPKFEFEQTMKSGGAK